MSNKYDREDPTDEWETESKKHPGHCPKCGQEYDYWKGALCACEDRAEAEEEEEEEEQAAPPTPEPKQVRKAYDPGTPGEVIPLGESRYSVQSFRNRSERYTVDLFANTCDCPHTLKRDASDCKHRKAARFKCYQITREKSESLPTETLQRGLKFYFNRPEIREAIEVELTARR